MSGGAKAEDNPALFAVEHPKPGERPWGMTRLAVEAQIEDYRAATRPLPAAMLPALRQCADFMDELHFRVHWPRNGMTAFPQIAREFRETYAAVFGQETDDDSFADALAAFRDTEDSDTDRPVAVAG